MDATLSVFVSVITMLTIISLAIVLKMIGILKKEHSHLFSRIVIQVTLPAIIFSSLATTHFSGDFFLMSLMMASLEIVIIIMAWTIAKIFQFKRGEKGALILVSSFGMTAMLGYPLIRQIFPGNALAMEEAVITGEFGVGFLLFIIGPLIAMYYGNSNVEGKLIIASIKKFIISPIFISLIAGLVFSFIPINPNSKLFNALVHIFQLVGQANLLMVAFTIGLVIEFKRIKHVYLFMSMAIILKLIIKPLLSLLLTKFPQMTDLMREIVFIETAMPSAILTAVYAKQYNCRPDLVSMAIMVTLVVSLLSISLLFLLFF